MTELIRRTLDALSRDVAFALRLIRRDRTFSLVAILTLALGVGANVAVLSVVRAVVFQPLPFREPSALVVVVDRKTSGGAPWEYTTLDRFDQWRRTAHAFDALSAMHGCAVVTREGSLPRRLAAMCVSPSFFPILGVTPQLGAGFANDAEQPGRGRAVLLTDAFWRRQFGGDPHVVGRRIPDPSGNGAWEIVGVLPRNFGFAALNVDVWAPLTDDPTSPYRAQHEWLVVGRLHHGVSVDEARRETETIASRIASDDPIAGRGWSTTVLPLQRFYADRGDTRLTLFVLLVAVSLLLLTACANLASLVVARTTARRGELALRLAIGASRARLASQLFAESIVLGTLGGVVGLGVAAATLRILTVIAPPLPTFRASSIHLDWTLLAAALAIGMIASSVVALLSMPGRRQLDAAATFRAGTRSTATLRDRQIRTLLVTVEIALSLVLVNGATLLVSSLRNLSTDRPGYAADHVLTFNLCCLRAPRYGTQQALAAFHVAARNRIARIPGVVAAATVSGNTAIPLNGQALGGSSPMEIRGRGTTRVDAPTADLVFAGPRYFEALQIPLIQGRSFDEHDGPGAVATAVVSASFARKHWPGATPLGQMIRAASGDGSEQWHEVVGVVADAKLRGLGTDVMPTVYVNALQERDGYPSFIVRTNGDPMRYVGAIKAAIAELDPSLPVDGIRTMESALGQPLVKSRFSSQLLSSFALLALVVATVGVFGMTAFMVAQRTQEIGVRIAMGARPVDVLRMVLRQALQVGGIGVAVGIACSLAVTRLVSRLLFGIGAADPLTFVTSAAGLLIVVLLACAVPARRASRIDPAVTLRAP